VLRRLLSLVFSAGLVGTAAGSAALAAHVMLLDTARVRASAPTVLRSGPVWRAMSARVSTATVRHAAAGSVSADELDRVTSTAMRDPRFVGAFADALVALQRDVFGGQRGPVVLPPGPVTAAVRDASADATPVLAATLSPTTELVVEIDARGVPDLHAVGEGIDATARVGLVVGIAFIALGACLSPRRRRALGRVSRFAVTVGVTNVFCLWLIPRFVLAAFGPWPAVAAAHIRTSAEPLAFGGLLLALAGATTLWLLQRNDVSNAHRKQTLELAALARRTSWHPPAPERTPQRGVPR
jgi:hypothetical protein